MGYLELRDIEQLMHPSLADSLQLLKSGAWLNNAINYSFRD